MAHSVMWSYVASITRFSLLFVGFSIEIDDFEYNL